MNRIVAVGIVATVLSAPGVAQSPAPLAITGVTIVDVLTGQTIPESTVVVRGTIIASIARSGAAPRDARVVDARGQFLIPGLWDMHAHHEATGEVSLALYVVNGVTGTRDMGSDLDIILRLRDQTASGKILGPRIVAAGPILDDAPPDWPFRHRVRTADDGRSAVQHLKQRGVDFIKVHDRTPRDAYFAIAEEARRQQLPLAGHVPRGITFDEVADAGHKSIEHLANFRVFRHCSGGEQYRPEPCRAFFESLARRGVWQTPTLAAWRQLMTAGTSMSTMNPEHVTYASPSLRRLWAMNQQASKLPPEVLRRFAADSDMGAVAVNDMQKVGVGILTGCDGMVPGFCVHDEIVQFVRGGMTPLAALQTATINPAKFLGEEKLLGTVAQGKRADVVLLDGNPLENIDNVRRIRGVVRGGKLLDRKQLDALLANVRRATMTP